MCKGKSGQPSDGADLVDECDAEYSMAKIGVSIETPSTVAHRSVRRGRKRRYEPYSRV